MVILVTAAIAGGLITIVSLWNYGAIVAFGCAPLGGSLLAVIAAALFARKQRSSKQR